MSFLIRILATIRSGAMPLVLTIQTFISCLAAIFSAFVIRKRWTGTYVIQLWARQICWLTGMRLHVQGLENIPEGGVLYVFNHQSLFDIPVMHAGIPRDFRFGAKIELFKIPIFGASMKAMNALPIARGNRTEAIRVLEGAAKRMNSGESFVLAAEGTRQVEAVIAEFKSGPFIMAIQAKRPIVPVVIMNIHEILPKKALFIQRKRWFSDIHIRILKPVNGAEFNFDNRDEFKKVVRAAMKREYDSH